MKKLKIYGKDEIQKVYHQHHHHCGSVLYSTDDGVTWQSVGIDSGKWHIFDWKFAFIQQDDDEVSIKNSLRYQWQFDGKFKHNGFTYTKGINDNSAAFVLNHVEPFKPGDSVYVWNNIIYQTERTYGKIVRVENTVAMVKYDDVDEIMAEDLRDLRMDYR